MSVFVLPAGIIYELESLFRDFLWAHGDNARGKCRISWDDVCQPECNGGLGFKKLDLWNRCLVTRHVWDIVNKRNSLWVKWIWRHYIQEANFWTIRKKDWWSWIFRSYLKIRPLVRPYFLSQIGNGLITNAWEDRWLSVGPLSMLISYRRFCAMGFSVHTTVGEFINSIGSVWPSSFTNQAPQLLSTPIPTLTLEPDQIRWIGRNNDVMDFTIHQAWDSLRPNVEQLIWTKVVWNKAYIPKHAVCLWIACHKRLPTQDRIMSWKQHPPDMKCLLCHQELETHNHLFFQCTYSKGLWDCMKNEVSIGNMPDIWDDIMIAIRDGRFNRWSTLQRITFTATVYYIWQERNRRLFDNIRRSMETLYKEARGVILQRMAWKRKCRHDSSFKNDVD